MPEAEVIRPAIKADGKFRPVYVKERDCWTCQRITPDDDGKRFTITTHGAHLGHGDDKRFSPLYLFNRTDAQLHCDMLNEGSDGH